MLPLAAVKKAYLAAGAQGESDLDYAAVFTVLEELVRVKFRA